MYLWTALIIFLGTVIPGYSFSQSYAPSSFFWNQYMHTNPAMTGAVYRHQANAQAKLRLGVTKYDNHPTDLWGNYAIRLDSINSGIGISYAGNLTEDGEQHVALVSYAYHIPFKNMFLSIGVSAGTNTLDPYSKKLRARTLFQGDFGIALHGERWNFGISSTRLSGYIPIAGERDPYMIPLYWVFGEYRSQIGKNGSLTPRSQIATRLNHADELYGSFALVAGVKNFWIGPSISHYFGSGEYHVGGMIGCDIAGRLRIGYTFELGLYSGFNPQISEPKSMEFILSYQLK